MSPKMIVLGTDHSFQFAEQDKSKIDDPSFRVLIAKLVRDFSLDHIFEEAAGCGPTTASKLQTTTLGYLDVDPPGDERELYGIPPGLRIESYYMYEFNDRDIPKPEPTATIKSLDEQIAREKHWIKEITETSFTSGLVICGSAHSVGLATQLKTIGFAIDKFLVYLPKSVLAKAWISEAPRL